MRGAGADVAGHVLEVLFQVLCAGHGPYGGLTSPLKSGFLQLRVIHLFIYFFPPSGCCMDLALVKFLVALREPVWLAACRSGEPSGGFVLPGPSCYRVAAHGVWVMAFLPSELALNNPKKAACSCSCYLFGGVGGSSLILFAFLLLFSVLGEFVLLHCGNPGCF